MHHFKWDIAMLDKKNMVQKDFGLKIWKISLKWRYSKNYDLLLGTYKTGDSWEWKSVTKGLGILRQHLRWNIGDGKKVYIWIDRWKSGPLLMDKEYKSMSHANRMWTSELITDKTWNIQLTESMFTNDNVTEIINTTLGKHVMLMNVYCGLLLETVMLQ